MVHLIRKLNGEDIKPVITCLPASDLVTKEDLSNKDLLALTLYPEGWSVTSKK